MFVRRERTERNAATARRRGNRRSRRQKSPMISTGSPCTVQVTRGASVSTSSSATSSTPKCSWPPAVSRALIRSLDHLLLSIHAGGPPGQFGEGQAVLAAVEPQLEALVHQPFAIQPVRQPGLTEQIDRALFGAIRRGPAARRTPGCAGSTTISPHPAKRAGVTAAGHFGPAPTITTRVRNLRMSDLPPVRPSVTDRQVPAAGASRDAGLGDKASSRGALHGFAVSAQTTDRGRERVPQGRGARTRIQWFSEWSRDARRGRRQPGRRHGSEGPSRPLRRVRYWTGENAAGSMILFSCVSSMSPPPGGGQAPAARAFSRISARWLRLSYGQMCR